MADTFATFAAKLDRFSKDISDDAMSHALGKMAKAEATKAASADLGGDPKFSGWAPTLDTRYDIVGPGRISFHPSRRSAGPWTVAEHGRNTNTGPTLAMSSLTPTGRVSRRKRKRYNGRTRGKGTATDAVSAIEREAPKVVQKQTSQAIKRIFG
jgi:hypothetical protein